MIERPPRAAARGATARRPPPRKPRRRRPRRRRPRPRNPRLRRLLPKNLRPRRLLPKKRPPSRPRQRRPPPTNRRLTDLGRQEGSGRLQESGPGPLHALPQQGTGARVHQRERRAGRQRSEEHTSELQSLMRISYAVFCLKKKTK